MRCSSESGAACRRSGVPLGCATAVTQAQASRLKTRDIFLADSISSSSRSLPRAKRSRIHDRLRGVADRLHAVAGVEERDDAAGAAFEALVAPGERADQRTLVEHEFDVAAEILGVEQALLERPVVERKHVGHDPALGFLVHVFEGAEELARRLAVLLGELCG